MIRVYVSRGFSNAKWMADEAFDRVMKRVPEIASTYEGDPAKYFYGVARNIMHEELRKKEIATDEVPEPPVQLYSHDDLYDCLMECMDFLSFEKQELILKYHLYHGKAKIDHHRQMAAELSITEGALRTRIHHLRVGLEKCILQCLSGQTPTQKPQLTT